jgi:hypothetical protein
MMTKNFATSNILAPPSPSTSGTTLTVLTGEGIRFTVGRACIAPALATPTPVNAEVVDITGVAGDTLSITRASESSTARTVVAGDVIYQGLTAAMLESRTRPHPAAAGIVAGLVRGRRSVVLQNTGDSTGDASDDWLGLLGQLIGVRHDYSVTFRQWNDTNQQYDMAATTLRLAAAGERYYDLRGAQGFSRTGANVAGDLDLRVKALPDSWTTGPQVLISKYDTPGNQRSLFFAVTAGGFPQLLWSVDGTATISAVATAPVPFGAGTPGWVRVQHDVNNGAGGNNVLFYTSTDGAAWTQLGATVTTAGVTSHFASTAPWTLGFRHPSTPQDYLTGRIYELRIADGLGVAGYDFMPTLPELWEPLNGTGGTGYTLGGAPVVQLYSGSQAGQGVSYFDNATRRPKIFANFGQKLLLTNTAINDTGLWQTFTLGTLQTWLTNVRVLLPGVPIVVVGQCPQSLGALVTTQDAIDVRWQRNGDMLSWAASGAVAGVWPADIYPAFPAVFDPALFVDGYLHPSAGLTGGQGLIAHYLLNGMFGSGSA